MDCENPAPLFADERIKVPVESSWLAETVALRPAKTLAPAINITDPANKDVATSRRWWLIPDDFISFLLRCYIRNLRDVGETFQKKVAKIRHIPPHELTMKVNIPRVLTV